VADAGNALWERPSGRDDRGLKPRSYLKPMQNGYNRQDACFTFQPV